MRTITVPLPVCLALALVVGCGGEEPEDRSSERLLETPPASDTTASGPESVGGITARRMETDGLVADLLDARRTAESLEVTIRFRNVSGETRSLELDTDGGAYGDWRLTAGGERIPLLVDELGEPDAPSEVRATLEAGQTRLWRAEFAPPPEDVATFDLSFPGLARPFTDVPIEDVENTRDAVLPIE